MNKKHQSAIRNISMGAISRGYPTLRGAFGQIAGGPPFDYFTDMMRGRHGVAMDMYRQPKKLHEAMEHQLDIMLAAIKNLPLTNSLPFHFMALHKGDDTFMSDKQFEEFYWPYLKKIFIAMINEGLVPMPFAEGSYTRRLKQITDMPKSVVVWWLAALIWLKLKNILEIFPAL